MCEKCLANSFCKSAQNIPSQDPDVDAIYRLLHAEPTSGLDESFNQFAPPVILAPGIVHSISLTIDLYIDRKIFSLLSLQEHTLHGTRRTLYSLAQLSLVFFCRLQLLFE